MLAAPVMGGCGGSPSQPSTSSGAAPPAYEVHAPHVEEGRPTAGMSGGHPRGTIILIHGGGWRGRDRAEMLPLRGYADFFRARGYVTLNVDYDAGAAGLTELEQVYDQARRSNRGDICAVGNSAGGHLALMLAVRRPALACVISLAGPTDLPALEHEPGGGTAYALAAAAFGTAQLRAFSPAAQARRIHARVLQVAARGDPFVPLAQAQKFAQAEPGSRLIILPPGDADFVHSKVDGSAARQALAEEAAFVDDAMASG